jgi:hypothetical protein
MKCKIHNVLLVRTEVEFGKELMICPTCQKNQSNFLADEWEKLRVIQHGKHKDRKTP